MDEPAVTAELIIEDQGAVRILRMNRPDKLNALNTSLTEGLCNALEAASVDEGVRAIVLTGVGRAFCAGADTGEFAQLQPGNAELVARRADLTCHLHDLLRAVPKPLISAVRGAAVGGGAGLAIGCDMMVAGEDIRFGYPELRHGLVPALVMTSLVRQIGRKLAFEMVSTGRMLDAAALRKYHLVNRIVPPAEVVDVAVALAETCAAFSGLSMQATKILFHQVAELPFAQAMLAGRDMNIKMRGLAKSAGET